MKLKMKEKKIWVIFQSNSLKLLHIHTMLCNYNCSHNKKKIHLFAVFVVLFNQIMCEHGTQIPPQCGEETDTVKQSHTYCC